jgi:hypothetical protein
MKKSLSDLSHYKSRQDLIQKNRSLYEWAVKNPERRKVLDKALPPLRYKPLLRIDRVRPFCPSEHSEDNVERLLAKWVENLPQENPDMHKVLLSERPHWFKHQSKWTIQKAIDEAKNFQSREEFLRSEAGKWMQRKKLLDHLDPVLPRKSLKKGQPRPGKEMTLEECKQDASLYQVMSVWKRSSPRAFHRAEYNGWLKECCGHMTKRTRWTLELCKLEAQKYSTRKQWQLSSKVSYNVSAKNEWLEECCGHMKKICHQGRMETQVP